jgi:hypothetical protein
MSMIRWGVSLSLSNMSDQKTREKVFITVCVAVARGSCMGAARKLIHSTSLF